MFISRLCMFVHRYLCNRSTFVFTVSNLNSSRGSHIGSLVTNKQTNSRKGLPWFAFYKQTEEAWLGLLFTNNQPTKKQKRLGLVHSLQTNKRTNKKQKRLGVVHSLQTSKQQQQKMLGLVCSLQTIKKQRRLACALIDTSATHTELVDDITFTDMHCQRQTGSSHSCVFPALCFNWHFCHPY